MCGLQQAEVQMHRESRRQASRPDIPTAGTPHNPGHPGKPNRALALEMPPRVPRRLWYSVHMTFGLAIEVSRSQ